MANIFNNPVKLLNETGDKFPDRVALIQPERKLLSGIEYHHLSYGELKYNVNEYIKVLKKKGVKKGDRIVLLIPFSFELYIAIIAIISIGAVAVFVEPWMMRKRYEKQIYDMDTHFVICSKKIFILLRLLGRLRRNLKYTKIPRVEKGSSGKKPITFNGIDYNDPAIVTFTTGSGNMPKTVVRSYGDLTCQLQHIAQIIHRNDTVDFITFPNLILFNISQGGTSLIPDKRYRGGVLDGEIYRKFIRRLKVGRVFASPANLEAIFSKDVNDKIEAVYTGGGLLKRELIEKMRSVKNIQIFYGSTEVEPISTIDSKEYIKSDRCRGYNVGHPVEGVEVKIDYFDNNIGEILVKDIEDEKSTYSKKFFKTGDVGYINDYNEICLLGRINNITKYNGKYVYPFELQFELEIEGIKADIFPVQVKKHLKIVVSGVKKGERIVGIIDKLLKNHNIIDYDILFFKKIPKDPRHHSKIDMKRLRKIIETISDH